MQSTLSLYYQCPPRKTFIHPLQIAFCIAPGFSVVPYSRTKKRSLLTALRILCSSKIFSWLPFRRLALADELRQCTHWAENAPGARLKKEHSGDGDDLRGQHEAIELERKRRHPRCDASTIGPVPRHIKCP